MEAMHFMEEAIFKKHQYIAGSAPSYLDKSSYELLRYNLYENMQLMDQEKIDIQPEMYPNTFAWISLMM
jgi:hypothetical protein